MGWRAYLRFTAIVINGVLVLWLISVQAWWMSVGYLGGLPIVVPPIVALVALLLSQRKNGL